MTYSGNGDGIVAETRQEVAEAVARLICQRHRSSAVAAGYRVVFDASAQGMRQIHASIAEGTATADDGANWNATAVVRAKKAVQPFASPIRSCPRNALPADAWFMLCSFGARREMRGTFCRLR